MCCYCYFTWRIRTCVVIVTLHGELEHVCYCCFAWRIGTSVVIVTLHGGLEHVLLLLLCMAELNMCCYCYFTWRIRTCVVIVTGDIGLWRLHSSICNYELFSNQSKTAHIPYLAHLINHHMYLGGPFFPAFRKSVKSYNA